MSENEKKELNTNQRKAIAALLSYGSVIEAAASIGMSEKTLYRYLQDTDFKRELNKAVKSLIDSAGLRLYAGQDEALDTISDVMKHARRDSDRRLAAATWLDFAVKWREIENVEERLLELEKAVFNDKD